jgi:hypothetical protein
LPFDPDHDYDNDNYDDGACHDACDGGAAPAAAWLLCAMMAAVTVPVLTFVAWNKLRSFLRIGGSSNRRRGATPLAAGCERSRWRTGG